MRAMYGPFCFHNVLVFWLFTISVHPWFPVKAVISNNNSTLTNSTAHGSSTKTTAIDTSSTTSNLFPNFVRPVKNPTKDCNLWGPLCQTGSIIVGVNLTSTVKKTTVPCSKYLSAQAESALPGYLENRGHHANYWPPARDYQHMFGRSPECSSYAHRFVETFNVSSTDSAKQTTKIQSDDWNPIITPVAALTFSNCASNLPQRPEYYTPPGVSNTIVGWGGPGYDYYCCGDCSLGISEIRLLYFPATTAGNCSTGHGFITSSTAMNSSSKKINHRAASLLTNGSVLVADGYTYTSPSFYLQIVGTASVSDSCGVVGSIYTNPVVAVPMGGLSTISLDLSVGATFMDRNWGRQEGNTIASHTKAVRTEDLLCPTWGLANSSLGDYATVGPPFNPIIYPPSELVNLDPAWKQCTKFVQTANAGGFYMYEVYDPPRALSPVAEMGPSTTSAGPITSAAIEPTVTTRPSAKPADSFTPNLPETTAKIPSNSEPLTSNSLSSNDLGFKSLSNPPTLASINAGESAAIDPQTPPSVGSGSTYPISASAGGNENQKPTPGLGGLIHSAFGASGPVQAESNGFSSTLQLPTPPSGTSIFVVRGSAYTGDLSSVVVIGGTTVSAGGPGMKAAGTSFLVGPSGLMVGSSVMSAQVLTLDPSVIGVAGQMLAVLDPSATDVVGTMLSVGGNPVTVGHAVLSLAPTGNIVIKPEQGYSNNPSQPANSHANTVFTVAGHTFTPNPSSFSIDGTVLSTGGSGLIISSTPISLAPSGRLIIGTSTAFLPSPSIFTVADHTFAADPSGVSIDGTTLSPGGPGMAISDTPVSLAPSGILHIGSSTLFLPGPSPPSLSQPTFAIAGQTYTGNGSALLIDGTTLIPGGPAVTISGTPVSLEPSGTLRVGSSDVPLFGNGTFGRGGNGSQEFLGGQGTLRATGKVMLMGTMGVVLAVIEVLGARGL